MEKLNWMPRPRTLAVDDLVRTNCWTTGAELGVWFGVTTRYLLQKHPYLHMVAVDEWKIQEDGELEKYTPGENGHSWNHEFYERSFRQKTIPYKHRLDILKMSTNEAAKLIENESLDFVFIDADHSTKGVLNDIKNWLPKLKPYGCLLGDDIDWNSVKNAVESVYPEYEVFRNIVWCIPKDKL